MSDEVKCGCGQVTVYSEGSVPFDPMMGTLLGDTVHRFDGPCHERELQRCLHGRTAEEPCGDCLADEGLDAPASAEEPLR